MIIEYHRPKTIEEALALLARDEPHTLPLAGGSVLNQPNPDPIAVVDLQSLGLDKVEHHGSTLILGAMLTLEKMLELDYLPPALVSAIEHEATHNLRNVATVAGTLIAAGGRSAFTTAMLALDIQLNILPGDASMRLGDLLPQRSRYLKGKLIAQIVMPLNCSLVYQYVARTPADLPIVCVAVAQWASGRTRVALGGYGSAPTLAMDGPQPDGAEIAAKSAYMLAQDEWASAEYRSYLAGILTQRCLDQLTT